MMRVAQKKNAGVSDPLGRASAIMTDPLKCFPLLGVKNDPILIRITH